MASSILAAANGGLLCVRYLKLQRDWTSLRHENGGCVGASLLHGICNSCKDRLSQVLGASFLWVGSSDNICAIFNCLLCVEGALLSGEALEEDLCFRGYSQIRYGKGQQGLRGVQFRRDSSSQFVFAYSVEAVA